MAPRAYLTQLTLPHSSRPHVAVMITQLTEGTTLPAEVVEQIVAKSEGMPLYVEEMTKAILDSGVFRKADGHYELDVHAQAHPYPGGRRSVAAQA
jgi:predicted ATPase